MNIERIEVILYGHSPKIIVDNGEKEIIYDLKKFSDLSISNAIDYVNKHININDKLKREINKAEDSIGKKLSEEEKNNFGLTEENIKNRNIAQQASTIGARRFKEKIAQIISFVNELEI